MLKNSRTYTTKVRRIKPSHLASSQRGFYMDLPELSKHFNNVVIDNQRNKKSPTYKSQANFRHNLNIAGRSGNRGCDKGIFNKMQPQSHSCVSYRLLNNLSVVIY